MRNLDGGGGIDDEDLLMAVLNSTPRRGEVQDEWLGGEVGTTTALRFGGTGSAAELAHLRDMRTALQGVVDGDASALVLLQRCLAHTSLRPDATPDGLEWSVDGPADQRLAARAALAWSEAARRLPGRLRACANQECRLYLLDHSRPGTARWCSMAVCGNRAKSRAYTERHR